MNKSLGMAAAVMVTAALCCPALGAEDAPGRGELRGTFVRHFGKEMGGRVNMAIEVKPLEGKSPVTVLVPTWRKVKGAWAMNADLMTMVLKLRKGQKLEIVWALDSGQRWARRIEAGKPRGEARREGERRTDRPREGERRPDRPREGAERERAERERRADRPREGERTERRREGEGERRTDRPREGERRTDRPREGQRERAEGERAARRREGERRTDRAREAENRELREIVRRLTLQIEAMGKELRALHAQAQKAKAESEQK